MVLTQISSTSCHDYGSSQDNGGQMGVDAIDAANATHQQVLSVGLSSAMAHTHDRSTTPTRRSSNLQMLNRCSALLSPTVGQATSYCPLRVITVAVLELVCFLDLQRLSQSTCIRKYIQSLQ